jgi:hypothetical protein
MHVARSSSITGPYTGDRVFYSSQRGLGINGPGHMGIFRCGQEERFTYHYYPTSRSVIGVNRLTWGADGWPIAGPQVTSPLQLPCPNSTGTVADAVPPVSGLRFRRVGQGYEVFLPASGKPALEILDPMGGTRRRIPAGRGWNVLPSGMLRPGMNLVRAALDQGEATALIFHDGRNAPFRQAPQASSARSISP